MRSVSISEQFQLSANPTFSLGIWSHLSHRLRSREGLTLEVKKDGLNQYHRLWALSLSFALQSVSGITEADALSQTLWLIPVTPALG